MIERIETGVLFLCDAISNWVMRRRDRRDRRKDSDANPLPDGLIKPFVGADGRTYAECLCSLHSCLCRMMCDPKQGPCVECRDGLHIFDEMPKGLMNPPPHRRRARDLQCASCVGQCKWVPCDGES